MLAMQSILATLESSVVCNELINILNCDCFYFIS